MLNQEKDTISYKTLANDFQGEDKERYFNDSNILLSFDIEPRGDISQFNKEFGIELTKTNQIDGSNEFQPLKVNVTLLKRFIVPYLSYVEEHQINRTQKSTLIEFQNCNISQFLNVGFVNNTNTQTKADYRLCPVPGAAYDKFKVKNQYTNTTNRDFVSMNIRRCDTRLNETCESNVNINKFLEKT